MPTPVERLQARLNELTQPDSYSGAKYSPEDITAEAYRVVYPDRPRRQHDDPMIGAITQLAEVAYAQDLVTDTAEFLVDIFAACFGEPERTD